MPDQSLDEIQRALEDAGQRDAVRILQSIQSTRHGSSSTPPRKPAPVVACTLCRRCKAKCIRSIPDASQCDRCRATGCVCVVEKHKRGRKRVRGLDLPRVDAVTPAIHNTTSEKYEHGQYVSSTSPYESHHHKMRTPNPTLRHSSPLSPDFALDAVVDPYIESERESDVGSASPVNQSDYVANPLPFISGTDRPFSLRNLLNPPSATRFNDSKRIGRARVSDVDLITRGVLSLDIAQQLFAFFVNTLNPIIMLFDPQMHTFEHVRGRSRFLLATMLAAAARFIAPSKAPFIAQEVQECSVQAVLGSRRSIETVQAWMVMFFYKAPRDDRGWTYVGLLCRLAVEIGLDRTPMEDMPGSSLAGQRERRDRIRTWMLAFMMDRAVSSTTGRDWCIRGHDKIILDTRSFSQHASRLHGDGVIAGFAELRRLASLALDHLSGKSSLVERRSHASRSQDVARYLLTVNYDLDEWKAFWQEELRRNLSPARYWAYLRFFELHIRLTLNSFAVNAPQLLRPSPHTLSSQSSVAAEQYCYDIAMENLQQLQTIRTLDVSFLQHAQDSISIMVAYAACFLRALVNSPNIADPQRDQASKLIHHTSEMFKTVSRDKEETSAALQADFLNRLFDQEGRQDQIVGMGSDSTDWPVPSMVDSSTTGGPHIDVTDFDAWLSAFQMDTLPDEVPATDDATMHSITSAQDAPLSMANGNSTDWDGIFLSWLNPDYST